MSFSAETRPRTRPVLPLAAMLDIMFLLLIFFVTTSTLRQQESQINVALPAAKTAQAGSTSATHVIITVTKAGKVYLGDHPITMTKLGQTLKALGEQSPDESVIIRGDRKSPLGRSVHILDMAQAAGLNKASLGAVESQQDTH